jgi:hypothetical protein
MIFWSKNVIFRLKTSTIFCLVMINFFHNLALVLVKNANFFAIFFGENILKIITLVPGHDLFTSGDESGPDIR